ncbi:hypothetical protein SZ55_0025 [Pseudomonas sp. FeS53a]|nr:hypothetical protein SZ55_0025 [Pseudomonas sp. FeS53a]
MGTEARAAGGCRAVCGADPAESVGKAAPGGSNDLTLRGGISR